jgi:ATP-dependent DNA ligase
VVGRFTATICGRSGRTDQGAVPPVFAHACKLGLEGIVSKCKGSPYRSGRSPDWLKMKNPDAPAVKREAEEDVGAGTDGDAVDAQAHLCQSPIGAVA